MAVYVLVEGQGEEDAVLNLLTRLVADAGFALPRFAVPIGGPGIEHDAALQKYVGLVRPRRRRRLPERRRSPER